MCFFFSAPIFFFILFWAKGKSLNWEEAVSGSETPRAVLFIIQSPKDFTL